MWILNHLFALFYLTCYFIALESCLEAKTLIFRIAILLF